MKLLRELLESVGATTALNTFRGQVISYVNTIREILAEFEDRDHDVAKRLAGMKKARWVSDNYLSTRHSGGLQQAAAELAKRAKDPNARQAFDKLANITYSATRDANKAGIFDQVGKLLIELQSLTTDDSMSSLLNDVRRATRELMRVRFGGGQQASNAPRASRPPQNELLGQQNAQAEEAFQQAVNSLPQELQGRIRRDTARMAPVEKLRYLRSIM
jgi:hypothetical protein